MPGSADTPLRTRQLDRAMVFEKGQNRRGLAHDLPRSPWPVAWRSPCTRSRGQAARSPSRPSRERSIPRTAPLPRCVLLEPHGTPRPARRPPMPRPTARESMHQDTRSLREAVGSSIGRFCGQTRAGPRFARRWGGSESDRGGVSVPGPSPFEVGDGPRSPASAAGIASCRCRQSASTSASSSAIPAPSAMFGEVACAASPTSITRPFTQESSATSSIVERCRSRWSGTASSRPSTGSAKPEKNRPRSSSPLLPRGATPRRSSSRRGRVRSEASERPCDGPASPSTS